MQSLLGQTPKPVHSGQLGQGTPASVHLGIGQSGGQLGAAFGQFGTVGNQFNAPAGQLGATGYVLGNGGIGALPQYHPQ